MGTETGSTEKTFLLMSKIKRFPEFDYRLAMKELYSYYQNSKYWKEVVKAVRKRDNNTCQDCGQTEGILIVHHNDYLNWGYGDQREIDDCILVCSRCHTIRHRNFSVDVPFWADREIELSREKFKELKEVINGFGI